MLCTGCGANAIVIGRFCGHCDERARNGTFERRRKTFASRWYALWGLPDPRVPVERRRRRGRRPVVLAIAALAIALAVCLFLFNL